MFPQIVVKVDSTLFGTNKRWSENQTKNNYLLFLLCSSFSFPPFEQINQTWKMENKIPTQESSNNASTNWNKEIYRADKIQNDNQLINQS